MICCWRSAEEKVKKRTNSIEPRRLGDDIGSHEGGNPLVNDCFWPVGTRRAVFWYHYQLSSPKSWIPEVP